MNKRHLYSYCFISNVTSKFLYDCDLLVNLWSVVAWIYNQKRIVLSVTLAGHRAGGECRLSLESSSAIFFTNCYWMLPYFLKSLCTNWIILYDHLLSVNSWILRINNKISILFNFYLRILRTLPYFIDTCMPKVCLEDGRH